MEAEHFRTDQGEYLKEFEDVFERIGKGRTTLENVGRLKTHRDLAKVV